ncbi:MAG TPA: IPT/TIG domain-containing protein, partial [Bryobacteraceae bacterium]|nr:IPT/TIG domain-containing protein [Bryobacteraceae bacterium]
QSLALNTPAAQALQFTVQGDGGAGLPAPAWLLLRLLKGSTPGRIPVAVDPTGLASGKYSARVLVITGDGRQTIVPVTLTLTDAPPQLEVSPGYLRFAGSASALAASEQALLVRNAGGGGPLPFAATVADGAPWLSVLPGAGQAAPNAPVSLRVLVNAQGLSLGARRGVIHVESAAGVADIPVSLLVRDEGAVIGFNLTGVRFETRDGAGSTRLRSANILNLGTGTVNWQASIVSGAEWLTLGATSGSATPAAPGTLPLSLTPGTLKSGNYYASIKITDPGSLNSPQFLSAMLAVLDEGSPADPDPTPSGLFFVGKTGGAAPPAQAVRIFTSSTTPVPFQISANTSDGGNWLSVNPVAGSASTANPGQVNVTVTPGALTPGVYTGDVTVAFSSTSIRTVNLTLVVQPATVVTASAKTRSVAGCTPAKMALAQTGLVNSFVAPAGWPTPMVVRLADDCGDPVLNAQIVLTYSNGDPAQAMSLTDAQNGVYSATWVPAKTGASVSVTARATASKLAQLTALLTGTVAPNKAPFLLDNSTLNSFNAVKGAALAPGTVATIRGSGLAATAALADAVPLPTSVNGTRVLVGGVEAPLYAVSDDQIKAQIPVELAANRQYQVLVSANGALTLPDTITLAAAQPGLQISEDGSQVVAQHSDTSPINPSSPATRGEEIILYLVGMGQTDPPVPSGVAAPGDTLATALARPTVTIGAQPAEVLFAGLTPGSVGLYQIRLRVPPDAQSGALNVQVTQGDAQSNPGVLPVQ